MKLITALAILVFCTGCDQRETLTHTTFFNTHDAKTYLGSAAKSKGLEIGDGGSSYSIGGPTGEKTFDYALKGDDSLRNTIMRDYKDLIEKELKASGVTINGRGSSGDLSSFRFTYHGAAVTGVVRINSVLDRDGFIQFDTFIYEHL